jgi:RNA polymerase sigma-70 factor (ECF subfamily)
MEHSDAQLLAEVSAGSQRAFNLFVDRHQQAVRNFLRRVVGPNEAEDVAQEAFLAVWASAASYRGDEEARAWLFGIAWRKAKDTQRSWFRRRRRDTAWHAHRPQHEDPTGELRYQVAQAMGALSLDQRAAVMLCLAQGYTNEEAAAILRLPLGTVKSHVLRGREKLRGLLGDDNEQHD